MPKVGAVNAASWGASRPLALAALLMLGTGACIQPKTSVDDFGTGGASTVTGDGVDLDSADADAEAEPDPDPSAEPTESDAAAPTVTPKPADAAVPVDAAKPVADAKVTPPPTPADAGTSEPPPSSTAPSKLSFSVTTVSANGRYSPRNIYAIWVVDAQDKFVKTLAKFARTRQVYLTGWNRAAGGNVVDAVTGATMSNHGTRSVTWDLTNASKQPVPDGDYKIVLELTDKDGTGPTTSVSFTKGPSGVRLNPPNASSFTQMSLVLE